MNVSDWYPKCGHPTDGFELAALGDHYGVGYLYFWCNAHEGQYDFSEFGPDIPLDELTALLYHITTDDGAA